MYVLYTVQSLKAPLRNLRIGDIVTLKALSGQLLQVSTQSRGRMNRDYKKYQRTDAEL